MNARLKIELLAEQTFTVRAGEKQAHGLRIDSEWEGLRKLVDPVGRSLIIDIDGHVLKGADGLLAELRLLPSLDEFVTVPATTLPSGTVVPEFRVGKYACSKSGDGRAQVRADGKPWVNINFAGAKKSCEEAGFSLITEKQWLAIAHQIWNQGENWTSGKVGEGTLYRGLHLNTVNGAQDGIYESPKSEERRWNVLANGERIYDIAGNIWQWVFDDVQGDADGKIGRTITADSLSRAAAPKDCQKHGGGWQPSGDVSWSGSALIRGGCWCSGEIAGVFRLFRGWPDYEDDYVGFRCTN